MKQLNLVLLVLALALCSGSWRVSHRSNNTIIKNRGMAGHQALLVYVGTIESMVSLGVGMHIEIDSSIGLRYDVVFERGKNVLSHVGIFYKFSNPHQTVRYNFLTHKATVDNHSGPTDSGPDVDVLGGATIDSFSCTHLQHSGSHEVTDYWMSTNVPGFYTFVNALASLDPNLVAEAISPTIFRWGGLVKLRIVDNDPKQPVTFDLKLQEANRDISFPASDFDVPTK